MRDSPAEVMAAILHREAGRWRGTRTDIPGRTGTDHQQDAGERIARNVTRRRRICLIDLKNLKLELDAVNPTAAHPRARTEPESPALR